MDDRLAISPDDSPLIVPSDRRVRVFVSSTLGELALERKAVVSAVTSLRQTPVFFEENARPHPPRAVYQDLIAQSDVVVGIYWHSYGELVPDLGISGIEDEANLARGRSRLVYVKEPTGDRDPALKVLLARIKQQSEVTYKHFTSADDLGQQVADDLGLLLAERFIGSERTRSPERTGRLPSATSSFVGRQGLIDQCAARMSDPEVRLQTLIGPGGFGKSRVAIEIARRTEERFTHGAAFVDLATLTDHSLVATAIANALGLLAEGTRSVTDVLRDHLAAREVLLVLDNLEHLVAAADVLADLLTACPGVRILATSRRPLRVAGEWETSIPPLNLPELEPLPSVAQLAEIEAVALFVRRAQAVRGDFSLGDHNAGTVARICLRLEGIPLAIELAAARCRLFAPSALLERLAIRLDTLVDGPRTAPERHRTMRGAIAWSYDLLLEEHRAAFRRLSVFAGGCSVAAVVDVIQLGDNETILVLGELVEASLLRVTIGTDGQPRFSMLETIREYAAEQLEAAGEAAGTRRLHATHVALAIQDVAAASVARGGVARPELLDRIGAELDNVRAAMAWADAAGATDLLLSLVDNTKQYWYVRGHTQEGERWLARALAVEGKIDRDRRAALLGWLAAYAGAMGSPARARDLLKRARRAARHPRLVADISYNAAVQAYFEDDWKRAEELYEQGRKAFEGQGDTAGVAKCLIGLANIAQDRGDWPDAEPLLAECGRLLDGLGEDADPQIRGALTTTLARAAHERGELREAARLYKESLPLKRALGNRRGVAFSLRGLATVARDSGDRPGAVRLFEEAAEAYAEIADASGKANTDIDLGVMLLVEDPQWAADLLDGAVGWLDRLGQSRGVAAVLDHLARRGAAVAPARVAAFAGAVDQLRAAARVAVSKSDLQARETAIEAARRYLGESEFEDAYRDGARWDRTRVFAELRAEVVTLRSSHGG